MFIRPALINSKKKTRRCSVRDLLRAETLVSPSALENRFKSRYVRQTTDNCQSQQLNTAVSLNCNCTCVGVCLRRKLLLLNNILSTLTATITFAGPTPVVVIITGPRVPTGKKKFYVLTTHLSRFPLGSFTNRPTTVTTATTATNTTATTAVSSTTTPSRAPSTTTTAMVTANFLG